MSNDKPSAKLYATLRPRFTTSIANSQRDKDIATTIATTIATSIKTPLLLNHELEET